MMILSTEADGEQHAEIISRVSTLIDEAGGTVDDVAEWGRRPIAYPVRKQTDGVYVIVTCQAEPAAIDEVCRILSISKEVVLRAMPFRLSDAELEALVDMDATEAPEAENPENPSQTPKEI